MDSNKKYWFYLYPHIYVSCAHEEKMLLYDTRQGLVLETQNAFCIQLIKKIYSPESLGVVELIPYNYDVVVLSFIHSIVNKLMGCLTEINESIERPINLLPVLNLQKDVDKLIKQGEDFIGDWIIQYLSELNIFLNGDCEESCPFCDKYYKQVKCCQKKQDNKCLSPKTIDKILVQANHSEGEKVNFLGGNLSLYLYWNELCKVISTYNFEFHLWMNYKHLVDAEAIPIFKSVHIDIIVSFPIDGHFLMMQIQKYGKKKNAHFHFLIENEEQLYETEVFYPQILDYTLEPIYTGKNLAFFEKNVYINRDDIFSEIVSFRRIFCNQKLNANDFGTLNILSDGIVKANLNINSDLGCIHEQTLLDTIYKELIENSAWRKIRNSAPCLNCLYQYLCPPPSNYEHVIGKNNLCKVHKKKLI